MTRKFRYSPAPAQCREHRMWHDGGVSPVVGVMLMLAVTVMIAALVSAAAGGLNSSDRKAPSTLLDVAIYSLQDYGSYSVPTMTILSVSGNVLPTRDLKIITYYTTPAGKLVKGTLGSQVAVAGDNAWAASTFTASRYSGVLYIRDDNRFGNLSIQDSKGGRENWFGNGTATLGPGDILVTPGQYCGPPNTDGKNPAMQYLFPGVDFDPVKKEFPAGSPVSVKIIHIPSGQVLFDKEVIIQ
jgi:archaeal type IV pilus assembly protein PilA